MRTTAFSKALPVAIGLSLTGAVCAGNDAGTTQTQQQKLEQIEQQMQALQAQLQELKAQNAKLSAQQQQQTQQQAALAAAQEQQQMAVKPSPLDNISLWGYGEMYYTHPTKKSADTQADLARAVFGIGYRFDDNTHFNSEFEVEHAVSSASDVGEFEVEQFYIEHKVADWVNLNAGLFLIPAGLLNESHEPTNFYGVQRNFVETLIIPSTWREGGLALHGNTESGIRWNVGLTTGLDLSKWNFTPEYAPYQTALELEDNDVAPMQATHQELALANAQHLSQYLSLNYSGTPGLLLGATLFTGGVVRSQPNVPDNERVTLWETHARWTPGKFDLSAVYAHGSFSNTAEANSQFPGTPNPIPASFYGYYGQLAYNLWESGGYRLAPFARAERYNMGASYDGIPAGFSTRPTQPLPLESGGFGYWPQSDDTVYTAGANFYISPNVVFKIDYQKFMVNTDFTRVDLGLGLSF